MGRLPRHRSCCDNNGISRQLLYIYNVHTTYMLRQIITPLESSFTIQLPKEMLGKTVEIIAFELKEGNKGLPLDEKDKQQRIKRIEGITKNSLVDMSTFKFNRDEANDYDK